MAKKTEWLTLTKDDIDEHFEVEIEIDPTMPQDDMQRMQIAQAYRAPGAGGSPLMSDYDILTKVVHDPSAELTLARARMQTLEATDPEVMQIIAAATRERWREDNREMVRVFENAMQPEAEFRRKMRSLSPEELQKMIDTAAEMKAIQMQGGPPPAEQVQMAQAAAEQQRVAQEQQSLLLPSAMPYQEQGPSPEFAPTQLGMTEAPQPIAMTADVLSDQMRRGRPQP